MALVQITHYDNEARIADRTLALSASSWSSRRASAGGADHGDDGSMAPREISVDSFVAGDGMAVIVSTGLA